MIRRVFGYIVLPLCVVIAPALLVHRFAAESFVGARAFAVHDGVRLAVFLILASGVFIACGTLARRVLLPASSAWSRHSNESNAIRLNANHPPSVPEDMARLQAAVTALNPPPAPSYADIARGLRQVVAHIPTDVEGGTPVRLPDAPSSQETSSETASAGGKPASRS